jgi:hypothetical protein
MPPFAGLTDHSGRRRLIAEWPYATDRQEGNNKRTFVNLFSLVYDYPNRGSTEI